MPNYDFQCKECDTQFELRRSFEQAQEPASCPHCGSQKTQKKLNSISFIANNGGSQTARAAESIAISSGGCGCGACSCGVN